MRPDWVDRLAGVELETQDPWMDSKWRAIPEGEWLAWPLWRRLLDWLRWQTWTHLQAVVETLLYVAHVRWWPLWGRQRGEYFYPMPVGDMSIYNLSRSRRQIPICYRLEDRAD